MAKDVKLHTTLTRRRASGAQKQGRRARRDHKGFFAAWSVLAARWAGKVSVDLSESEDKTWVWLAGISSYDRGQGFASEALTAICGLADQSGVELALEAHAFEDESDASDDDDFIDGLTTDELKEWYERHGFVENGDVMERDPVH